MRRVRLGGAVALVMALVSILVPIAIARPAALDVRCTTFRAPNMYAGGPAGRVSYGVYVAKGRVSCGAATLIMRGLAYGDGRVHNGSYQFNSYTLYRGWICPAGQMGETTCSPGSRLVRNPKTQILSLECSRKVSSVGCPARLKNDY